MPLSAKDSTSHHRVVRYVFGGMTFLVRSAVDAYLRDRAEDLEPADGDKQAGPEELTDFVKAMSLDEPTPSLSVFTASVAVIPGGRQIPHAATLELSTRLKWVQNVGLLVRKMPDLWISQTANFMEAYHGNDNDRTGFSPRASRREWRGTFQSSKPNSESHVAGKWRGTFQSPISDRESHKTGKWRGAVQSSKSKYEPHSTKFTDIKITSLTENLVAWEAANANMLGRLGVVMKKVIEATEKMQGPCIVSCDGKARVLNVTRAEEGEVPGLPQELQDLFSRPGHEY